MQEPVIKQVSMAESIHKKDGLDESTHRPFIIAVDGPAGSGKSTICAAVCERLGWTYINTGAIYRAIGLIASESKIDLHDEEALVQIIEQHAQSLHWNGHAQQLWLGERNLTPQLGCEDAGRAASILAKLPRVRERLLPVQRQLAATAAKGAIIDGRDIGTVVFPDADLKVFLTASLEERSRRRMGQLANKLDDQSSQKLLASLQEQIANRDKQDQARGVAPLRQAEDAVILDTSRMTLQEVVHAMIDLITKYLERRA